MWKTSLDNLKLWLQEQQMVLALADDPISGLKAWYEEDPTVSQQLNTPWQEE